MAKKKADTKAAKGKDKKEKTFTVKFCPKCKSDEVIVAIGARAGNWECKKCGHKGTNFVEKEMNEEEYMEYLDNKGFEVPELDAPKTVHGVDDKSASGGEKKSYKDILRERLARGEEI